MAISNLTLPVFPSFSMEEYNTIATRWEKYKKRFENLVVALNVKEVAQKKALLLNYIGEEAYDVYANLATSEQTETYEQVIALLDAHFAPKSNITYERYLLRSLKQNADEKLQQYFIRVKEQAKKCDFAANLDSEIKQHIILSTTSNKLRRYSFRNQDTTLEQLLLYGKSLEDAESQAEQIEKVTASVADVNLTRRQTEKTREFGKSTFSKRKSSQNQTFQTCFRCGGVYPHTGRCPATGQKCDRCQKQGHFERCCRTRMRSGGTGEPLNQLTTSPSSRNSNAVIDNDCDLDVYCIETLFLLDENTDKTAVNKTITNNKFSHKSSLGSFERNIMIDGTVVKFLIDTGSSINIINLETFNRLQRKKKDLLLRKSKTKIVTYGQAESSLEIKGTCYLTLETASKITTDIFYVVNTKAKNLLKGNCAIELDLICLKNSEVKIQPTPASFSEATRGSFSERNVYVSKITEAYDSNVPERLQHLIESYRPNLFSGKIGKLKNTKIKLHIDETVPPVAQAERRIPFSLRNKVKTEIEHLEKQDIIEDVTSEATPWLSPLVIVPKANDEVRLCVDMRNANTAIQRTRFPTPTVDDLMFKLKNARYFTKLDLNSAFHQLEIDENSRYITAFRTEDRVKRFKRLIFGLNSASEQLQHHLQVILTDIPGVLNIADDILIFALTISEHDEILRKVFERLSEKGLTLNLSKCIFSKESVEYFGFIFSKQGIKPSES